VRQREQRLVGPTFLHSGPSQKRCSQPTGRSFFVGGLIDMLRCMVCCIDYGK
jgi:hypothetical protein